jgi:hypothetical protein
VSLRTREKRVLAAIVAGFGATVLVAGCGGSSTGAAKVPAKGPAKSLSASLARAADVSSAAPGYKMSMALNETVANQTINMDATGSYAPAAHTMAMTMNMDLPAEGGAFQMQMVLENGTMYMKLPPSLTSKFPGGKPWLSANLAQLGKAAGVPGLGALMSSSSSLNDPGEYLDFLRADADGTVTNLGQQTVDGVETTHYHAVMDLSKLPSALPTAQRKAIQQLVTTLEKPGIPTQMPVDAWIDGSNLIRMLKINYTATVAGKSVTEAITEKFLSYGAQPTPAVPSLAQTTNLLSLANS